MVYRWRWSSSITYHVPTILLLGNGGSVRRATWLSLATCDTGGGREACESLDRSILRGADGGALTARDGEGTESSSAARCLAASRSSFTLTSPNDILRTGLEVRLAGALDIAALGVLPGLAPGLALGLAPAPAPAPAPCEFRTRTGNLATPAARAFDCGCGCDFNFALSAVSPFFFLLRNTFCMAFAASFCANSSASTCLWRTTL